MGFTQVIVTLVKHLCSIFLVFIPVLIGYFLFNLSWFQMIVSSKLNLPIQFNTVEAWQWYAMIVTASVPLVIKGWGIYHLRQLFTQFQQGHYFLNDNIDSLKKFALSLLIVGFLNPLVLTIASVLLSINHPSGQKILSVNFGSDDLALIFNALVFWVVTYVLAQGKALDNENRQFI